MRAKSGYSINTEIDVNTTSARVAAIYLGVLGAAVFIVQPGFVQGLVANLGFSEQEAGYIASAEQWGIAVTCVAMALGLHRAGWRRLLRASVLLFVVGNLASMTWPGFLPLAGSRFAAGLGAGGLISLTFTILGLTRHPDRNFGLLITAVLSYGAVGLWLVPILLASIGMQGILLFFTVFSASGWFAIGYLPASGVLGAQLAAATSLSTALRWVAVVAMFAFFLAEGSVWAYLFLMGLEAGVAEQQVADSLTLSQILGIGGALLTVMLGSRLGRSLPLLLGIGGCAMSCFFLFGSFSASVYLAAVCLNNFAWNFVHPYLLACMASFDLSGRIVMYAVAAQMLGLAVGPALAATLLGFTNYDAVLWMAVAFFAVSYGLIMLALRGHATTEAQAA